MLRKLSLLIFLSAAFLFVAPITKAAEVMFFDSTNNYLGACQLTNRSQWDLTEDTQVTKFEIWYKWDQGETALPVKLLLNGESFAEFNATRGACDPYQQTWCNADFQINKLFPKGKYSTEIPNSRQCLKPGGTGAVRLYKEESATTAAVVKDEAVKPTPVAVVQTPSCACNQKTIVITTVITSLITSSAVFFFLKKLVK
jgi:hypothetical protein